MKHLLVIEKPADVNQDYGISVPTLPGCFTTSIVLDDVETDAGEAIVFHQENPEARTIELENLELNMTELLLKGYILMTIDV